MLLFFSHTTLCNYSLRCFPALDWSRCVVCFLSEPRCTDRAPIASILRSINCYIARDSLGHNIWVTDTYISHTYICFPCKWVPFTIVIEFKNRQNSFGSRTCIYDRLFLIDRVWACVCVVNYRIASHMLFDALCRSTFDSVRPSPSASIVPFELPLDTCHNNYARLYGKREKTPHGGRFANQPSKQPTSCCSNYTKMMCAAIEAYLQH